MNLGWLDPPVGLVQFGYALGLIAEHLNPNARLPWNHEAIYKKMTAPPFNWDRATIDHNFFRKQQIPGYRDFDVDSVMMKPFSRELFTDGIERGGKTQLSKSDKDFIRKLYPPT
jgi:hypothetical protein